MISINTQPTTLIRSIPKKEIKPSGTPTKVHPHLPGPLYSVATSRLPKRLGPHTHQLNCSNNY